MTDKKPAKTKPTLADVLVRYRDTVVIQHRSCKNVTYAINAMLRDHTWLVDMRMKRVTAAHIAQWRDIRMQSAKAGTVAREMTWLRHAIELARGEWCMVKGDNAATLCRKPRQPRARERRVGSKEWHRLLTEATRCRNPLFKPLVVLAVETAMRRGELVSMLWRDVDIERRTITLHDTKNGTSRTVPLTPIAVDVLAQLPRNDDRVLPISGNAVRLTWDRVRERAQCSDLRFHDLRHEAISRFVERGLSLVEVQKIAGHADLRMLMRYTHLRVDDIVSKLHASV